MYKLRINGQLWKCFSLEADDFIKKFGEGIAGLCDQKRCQIFFVEDDLELETVVHELVHAYYSHLCLSSADLTNDQVEETFAEMFAKHGQMILKQARNVYKNLRE